MSTTPENPTTPPAPTASTSTTATAPTSGDKRQIVVISRSQLFYWWPVWVWAYVCALITYFEGHKLAILPDTTHVEMVPHADPAAKPPAETKYELTFKGKANSYLEKAEKHGKEAKNKESFMTKVSEQSWVGVSFCFVLLMVIFITNIPLRGLMSLVVVMGVGIVLLILGFTGFLDKLFDLLGHLHIYINMGGYFTIATALLVFWIIAFYVFDPMRYMVFTPGQVRVREEIGAGEVTYSTEGMSAERKRDDIFRHIGLGFGSGDLVIRTFGAQAHTIYMPNVLRVDKQLKDIQEMLRDRPIVSGN